MIANDLLHEIGQTAWQMASEAGLVNDAVSEEAATKYRRSLASELRRQGRDVEFVRADASPCGLGEVSVMADGWRWIIEFDPDDWEPMLAPDDDYLPCSFDGPASASRVEREIRRLTAEILDTGADVLELRRQLVPALETSLRQAGIPVSIADIDEWNTSADGVIIFYIGLNLENGACRIWHVLARPDGSILVGPAPE